MILVVLFIVDVSLPARQKSSEQVE